MNSKNFLIGCLVSCLFWGCVTKQKYNELDALYKTCTNDLKYTTAEKIDFENSNKDLKREIGELKDAIEKLTVDTTTMSRKIRQTERELNKARKDYDDLQKDFADINLSNNEEVKSLLADLDKMKSQLSERETELQRQSSDLEQMSMDLSEKENRLNELQKILDDKNNEVKALRTKVADALHGFEGSGLKVEEKNGKVYVSMDEKLLFASGSWSVGAEGEKAIKELAVILETDTGINVLVEGHTDNVPYKGSGQVKDNWDLSVLRATSVVKNLLKYGTKIDPQRVSASGRGEFFPLDKLNTPEARAKNRRTEIILTPKLDELLKIIETH
ncbi:MAG: OmpA family protein [Bacteroidales bacterium]|jgi:chemotaxis protein MotB|nr:OmpA family protein [Bacteroidales bacterium]